MSTDTKALEYAEWVEWFAWHPVKTLNGEWVWWTTILRNKYPCWQLLEIEDPSNPIDMVHRSRFETIYVKYATTFDLLSGNYETDYRKIVAGVHHPQRSVVSNTIKQFRLLEAVNHWRKGKSIKPTSKLL